MAKNKAGETITLLGHDQNNASQSFHVNKSACNELMKQADLLNRELIVIAINGEYRKGKSFFLNYVMRYLRHQGRPGWMKDKGGEGFTWRGGKERCTDGIQMWSHAFPLGTKYAVVLLDTEGTYDEQSSHKSMSNVFACVALISSLQIFNVPDRITKHTMQDIQFFTEIARVSSGERKGVPPFQKLLILVRDWIFFEEDDTPFGQKGGNNHLNHWLAEETDKDGVSKTLHSCFDKVECYLMPKPSTKVINSRDHNLSYEDLGEEFSEHLQKVIEILFSPQFLESKKVGDKKLLLKDFPGIFEAYAKAVNTSGVEPKSMLELQVENCCTLAVENAEKAYVKAMETECDSVKPHSDLPAAHKKQKQAAIDVFHRSPIFGGRDKPTVLNHEKKLVEILDLRYKTFERLNLNKEINCSKINEKDKMILQLKSEKLDMELEHKRRMDEEMLKRATLEKKFDVEKIGMLQDFAIKLRQAEQDATFKYQKLEFEKEREIQKLIDDASQSDQERELKIAKIRLEQERAMYEKNKTMDELQKKLDEEIEKNSKDGGCSIL